MAVEELSGRASLATSTTIEKYFYSERERAHCFHKHKRMEINYNKTNICEMNRYHYLKEESEYSLHKFFPVWNEHVKKREKKKGKVDEVCDRRREGGEAS